MEDNSETSHTTDPPLSNNQLEGNAIDDIHEPTMHLQGQRIGDVEAVSGDLSEGQASEKG